MGGQALGGEVEHFGASESGSEARQFDPGIGELTDLIPIATAMEVPSLGRSADERQDPDGTIAHESKVAGYRTWQRWRHVD